MNQRPVRPGRRLASPAARGASGPAAEAGALLRHRIKAAVAVPVIASLNGRSVDGWLAYARLLVQARADALELNVYELATDPRESAAVIEDRLLAMVRAVRDCVPIPVAVKLSPFYTAVAHLAEQLDHAGAHGLVLFNRFYQPDIDVELLEVANTLHLSDSSELLLRTTWLAALSPQVRASLAVSGGVHTAVDAVKAVMAGAHAVQMVSALLRHGPEHLRTVREAMAVWLEAHEYDSLRQFARQHEPAALPGSAGFRARQLRQRPAELARRRGHRRPRADTASGKGRSMMAGFRIVARSMAPCSLLLLAAPAHGAEPDEYGKKLYARYCSACHGSAGKGDGVVSQFMRPKPADLTQLAKKAGGKFPYYEVMRTIDGRETVRAHGDSDMPVWGELFTKEEGVSPQRYAVARGKVVLITDYVESLQEK